MIGKLDKKEYHKRYREANKERINKKRRENNKAKRSSEPNKREKFINEA